MTKEQKQAIEYLKADIKYWEDTSVSTDHLIMAIKALEQQPCEDCVSRQKVKDGMRKYGFHSVDMTITEFVEDELLPVTPKNPTSEDCVSLEVYNQVVRERDIAIEQLKELGYSFGEKVYNETGGVDDE